MADELDSNFFEGEVERAQTNFTSSDVEYSSGPEESNDANSHKEAKKLKRKLKFEQMKAKKQSKPAPSVSQPEVALSPAQQLQLLLNHQPDARASNLNLSENDFADLSSLSLSQDKLNAAIQLSVPDFNETARTEPEDRGSPTVVVVCSSAIRSVEVIGILSKTLKCKIGKLFAKHFKVQVLLINLP